MMEQPRAWSVSGLAVELGRDRRTIARALEGLEPAGHGKGGELLFRLAPVAKALADAEHERLRDELARLRRKNSQNGGGAAHLQDYLLENRGPLHTLTGAQLMEMFEWRWEDMLELIAWGMPPVVIGRRGSPSGWIFSGPHVFRWLGIIGIAGNLHRDPRDTPAELRGLRGHQPLRTPSGFAPFDPAPPTRSKRPGAEADAATQ